MKDAVTLRHRLHREPDLSSDEAGTAAIIDHWMQELGVDDVARGLGGHGAVYAFDGQVPGPSILLRCELDALPIDESTPLDYRSQKPGISHKCGHDGHMAIVAAVARGLAARRPPRGKVILLFQPAEETGEGAARVLEDLELPRWRPDYVFALHNLPGSPLGAVLLRTGSFNHASVGMVSELQGKTSHAAHPEAAINPSAAIAQLMLELPDLPRIEGLEGALLTVTHARSGQPSLGITPGEGQIMATLRSPTDGDLQALRKAAETSIHQAAEESNLTVSLTFQEPFRALVNNAEACQRVAQAAKACGLLVETLPEPLRWSEDFSELTHLYPGALFGLGSGVNCPPLHSPDYDFPDALIETGATLFRRLVDDLLA